MADSLLNRRIFIRRNDFVDQDLSACITSVDESSQTLLLELDTPLVNNNTSYSHAVASPRLAKDTINLLIGSGVLGCSVTWVPERKFNKNEPMDLSWWRGGGAAITDLYI